MQRHPTPPLTPFAATLPFQGRVTERAAHPRVLSAHSYRVLGPASSQIGIAIGTLRAGIRGGVAAWLGFTLPSAVALVLFAELVGGADVTHEGWLHGLKVVAVAVVAQAGTEYTPQCINMPNLASPNHAGTGLASSDCQLGA